MALQRQVKWFFVILVAANVIIIALAFTGGFGNQPPKGNPGTNSGVTETNRPYSPR